jgi:hypothetical protein
MKKNVAILFLLHVLVNHLAAQVNGSFIVRGDLDKFYPVKFIDGGWSNNIATELSIGRSSVHIDATWRGSVIASFRYHVTAWGHESSFIDADVKQFDQYHPTNSNVFIAGWYDATRSNTSNAIIIWLRGGNTTYYYQSNYAVSPAVYDGVQNPLPYQEATDLAHSYKTAIEKYVNNTGQSNNYTAYFNGTGLNYFKGNVGIGTDDTKGYRLAVNGDAVFTKVKVKPFGNWPDYVFHSTYRLRSLSEVAQYIQQHHHLPEVPSAEEVKNNGLDVGDNQAVLLKKIEELTLYIIHQNKQIEDQERSIREQKEKQRDSDLKFQSLQQEVTQLKEQLKTVMEFNKNLK